MNKIEYEKLFEFGIDEDRMHYPIDGTNARYCINRKGGVFDTKLSRTLMPIVTHGHVYFKLRVDFESFLFPWFFVYLMAFSPLYVDLKTYKEKIKLRTYDPTITTPDMNNINWLIPEGGVESVKYPGYYGIPNNPHLVVSKTGDFLSTISNKPVLFVNDPTRKDWYYTLSYPIAQKKTSPRTTNLVHRLIAFAFLPVKETRAYLFVNHKNGIKTDFAISNLEWVNHTENAKHAIATGLRGENKPVVMYNVLTKEKKTFVSMGECAKFFGVQTALVVGAIKHYRKNKTLKFKPWIITEEDDPAPRLEKALLGKFAYSQDRRFKVINAEGEITYCFGNRAMLKLVGSSRKRAEKYPDRLKDFEINRCVVTDVEVNEVPVVFLLNKPVRRHGSKPQKKVRVTKLSNNEVIEYDNTDAFATVVCARRKTIQRGACYNAGVWNGYRLEYFN